jgi:MFS family permease
VLLYPLYALLFAGSGLSTAEISSLFILWSLTGLALEVPSGAWADTVSRRRLLALAPLLSGAGFGLWVLAPAYGTFAVGFVLWGAQGALTSGALEALVYEELDRAGQSGRYAELMGRATALGTVASAAAIGLAAPVFAVGGFAAVGAASVLACLATSAVGATFPEHRAARGRRESGWAAYASAIRAATREIRRSPPVRRAMIAVPAVTAVWGSLDEYLPLLALETGAAVGAVPLLGLLVYAGVAAGGLLAGRSSRSTGPRLAALLLTAATALAAGALMRVPAGFALVAAAFCLFQIVTVVVDARLQDAIEGDARSTVTSLASLGTEVLVIGCFAGYAAGAAFASHAHLFAAGAATYLAVAAVVARR